MRCLGPPRAAAPPPRAAPPPPPRRAAPPLAAKPGAAPAPAPARPPRAAAPPLPALEGRAAAALLAAAGGAFALLALDLSALHACAGLDAAAHAWVVAHMAPAARAAADGALSDAPIVLGEAGWAAAALGAAARRDGRAGRRLGAGAAVFAGAAASIGYYDPPLVKLLKGFFGRARPSTLHASLSFPSGHAESAAFVVGALLYIVLPAVLAEPEGDLGEEAAQGAGARVGGSATRTLAALRPWAWAAATGVTATGRVLADAHWVTDVAAGACVGAGMVAVMALLCAAVDPPPGGGD